MASKSLLKDFLEEDQEPFQLKSYISDRRSHINPPVTHLQVKKRRPISQKSGLPSRFCRNACFFSLRESPDPRKSPLFELKSPNRNQNAIFVNIPAKTASILLEAAVRIQKQSSEGSKPRRNAGNAFGLFGSVLKKLTHRKKREISDGKNATRVSSSVKDMLRWESPVVRKIVTRKSKRKNDSSQTQKIASETQFSRRSSSSGVWSESVTNGERSWDVDFEASISCCSQSDGSDQFDEIECGTLNGPDLSEDKRYCESPFHFVLQTMPSPWGFKTPNFASPTASPLNDCLQKKKKKESYEVKKLEMEEEEEDKEQSSPVSVLDPPFQDDDEDLHMDDDNNISSSFRSVQKAKHLLLQKLCRFEDLAGLDPMELEKRISDQETEEEEVEEMNVLYDCEIITQRVLKTYFDEVPESIETLILDLAAEELQSEDGEAESDIIAKRVHERLRSWRDVESNTIDMMVDHDFRTESLGLWRSKNDAEVAETVLDIEFEIFEDLVEELSEQVGGDW